MMIHRQAVFGTVVDDARVRWEQAEKEWSDAVQTLATTQVRDPEDWKQAIKRLRAVADEARKGFDNSQAAAEEARKNPLRPISLTKTRQLKEEIATGQKPGVSLGTVAILASPLVVAALLVWRMR